MKCLICAKSSEKLLCDDCGNKKRCKDCTILKTDFYKYKNNKIYSTCIECFKNKVKCEYCYCVIVKHINQNISRLFI